MTENDAEVASAGGALATLIHQFSDPLSFYRELVQNALDAGSLHVEVHLTYHQDEGQAEISIEDGGHGMDANVIDTQLTRLFASKKDGDLTRIGKFGIGFVSVFALKPERVTLETWSDDKGWLVEFLDNGEFERRPLTYPREGTLIRVFKSMSPVEFATLVEESRETLLYWCKHVKGEIMLNGEVLNRPFTAPAPVVYKWSEPDTEIVLGYPPDGQPFTGFYNQGLTLLETTTEHTWPGLAVKANSRFLEHTLTRDNIVKDENFQKVTARIHEMLEHELVSYLFSELSSHQHREAVFSSLLSHFGWRRVRLWKGDDVGHQVGRAAEDGWEGVPGEHKEGFLVESTPSLAGLIEQPDRAVFRLSVPEDQHTSPSEAVGTLSLYDLDEQVEVVSERLRWEDFRPRYGAQNFHLDFTPRPGQQLEFRLYWNGRVPLIFHHLELRKSVTRDMNLSLEQKTTPVFLTPEGEPVSIKGLEGAHAENRLWFLPSEGRLSRELEKDGQLVVKARPGTREWEFLDLLLKVEPRRAELELVAPVVEETPQVFSTLTAAVKRLLNRKAENLEKIVWAYPDCSQNWFALLTHTLDGYLKYDKVAAPGGGAGTTFLILNSEHQLASQLLTLAEKEPEMTAYFICKQFLSQGGLTAEEDARLALEAWSLRDE